MTNTTTAYAQAPLPDAAALSVWLNENPGQLAVVMVSLPGCPFCEIVRREQLVPLRKDPAFPELGVFEISSRDDLSRLPLRGEFVAGSAPTDPTPAELSRSLAIRMSPTVLFLNRSTMLAEPLVGYPGPDFYWAILSDRIETGLTAAAAGGRVSP